MRKLKVPGGYGVKFCALAARKLAVLLRLKPRLDRGKLTFFLRVANVRIGDCSTEPVGNDGGGTVNLGFGRRAARPSHTKMSGSAIFSMMTPI
jgi:hypothetical protein